MIEKKFNVIDKAGVHARPASILVSVASHYESQIKIIYKEKTANLKSILGNKTVTKNLLKYTKI
ncbi:HPr family phosphocarrier protein [Lysinibacillus mangiferihumi]|uniref:Phosphocarrier protein HPr n=1 Tax=Lysinibacillus mangiferihumi TaxID=1130819 RepID=A0A4U2Z217_9BACI|nr:HPr family phosphocarrier protein [Lysinibacillus mangiferihumi]TKI67665.1 HPr family phosphocarrier protein [Lysinibacillus mangiferihumi]